VSFLGRLFGRGRRASAPPAALGEPARLAEVEAVLTELRPLFVADGGDMRVVSVDEEGLVILAARGACRGCAISELTLRGALAPRLAARCAWFREVRLLQER